MRKTGLSENILKNHELIKEMSQDPEDYLRKFELEKNTYQMDPSPEFKVNGVSSPKSQVYNESKNNYRSGKTQSQLAVSKLSGNYMSNLDVSKRGEKSQYGSIRSEERDYVLEARESDYRSHSMIKRDMDYDQYCTNIEMKENGSVDFMQRDSAKIEVTR